MEGDLRCRNGLTILTSLPVLLLKASFYVVLVGSCGGSVEILRGKGLTCSIFDAAFLGLSR